MYMYHGFTVSGFSCHFPASCSMSGRNFLLLRKFGEGGRIIGGEENLLLEVDLFLNLILEKGFNLIPALEEFNLI